MQARARLCGHPIHQVLIVFPLGLLATAVIFDVIGLVTVLSFAGVGLALVTGWLGGELVGRLGVGVDEGANVNAPSSLSGRPATERR